MTAKSMAIAMLVIVLFAQFDAAGGWGQVRLVQSGGVAYRSPYGGSLYYLGLPQVEKELELADYQREQIKELRESINKEMRTGYEKLRELPREERTKKYYEQMSELSDSVEKRLQEILLDHQRDRLKQISLQLSIRYRGVAASLEQSELSGALDISEKQKKELREKRQEMYKELQQEYQRIRKEAQQELLESILTPKQLRELKKMMGKEMASP